MVGSISCLWEPPRCVLKLCCPTNLCYDHRMTGEHLYLVDSVSRVCCSATQPPSDMQQRLGLPLRSKCMKPKASCCQLFTCNVHCLTKTRGATTQLPKGWLQAWHAAHQICTHVIAMGILVDKAKKDNCSDIYTFISSQKIKTPHRYAVKISAFLQFSIYNNDSALTLVAQVKLYKRRRVLRKAKTRQL